MVDESPHKEERESDKTKEKGESDKVCCLLTKGRHYSTETSLAHPLSR
jgi:hypothetical protein